MSQPFRLPAGGALDRSRELRFSFDGRDYRGHPGDTLASALLANGVRLLGRSFKYHRPRGLFSAGPEEPNALVELRSGARREPNTRATVAELYDGLAAASQHAWPSLRWDVGALNGLAAPFIPAGFYYKTFMGPTRRAWMVYEHFIRKAAGLGRAAREPDPDRYEKRHGFCDLLVVGSGPAGLAAALAAGRAGARVVLAEQDFRLGGQLLSNGERVGGKSGPDWVAAVEAELASLPNVEILTRTSAFGLYDGRVAGLVERVADHKPEPEHGEPRQRLHLLRCGEIVLAAGAIERPLVFANNDLPGVMLASAARTYARRYAARAGTRAVLFASHDAAYAELPALLEADIQVAAVIDPRPNGSASVRELARDLGIEVRSGQAVARAHGGRALVGVEAAPFEAGTGAGGRWTGPADFISCDLLCVAGGWTPTLHLHSHSQGKTVWDPRLLTFRPGENPQGHRSVGACNGSFTLSTCLAEGFAAGAAAAAACGFEASAPALPATVPEPGAEAEAEPLALFACPKPASRGGKAFVDIQDDVAVSDIGLAEREGYRSVEHLKRYTTLGMGTDQGKTANVNGLAVMAELRGLTVPEVGHTTFRPPYTPVTLGALGGREVGRAFRPVRRTPLHDWHLRNGAVMVEAGLWLRPRYYPKPGEGLFEAQNREAKHVRRAVGLSDVSTLGKIDVQGPDAAAFLDRVYCNTFSSLPVGKARYGLMLREDGIVLDDGTTTRLSETRFFMTTTTAEAAAVMAHLEFLLQAVWPELRVNVASVTDQWAGIAVAGPRSRRLLEKAVEGCPVDDAALPFMGVAEGRIAGVPVRIFRISFSGERAYEVNVAADHGPLVWEALMEAGKELEVIPYGLEALAVLRIEKGHVAGPEIDGRTTPEDLGLGRMVSKKKADFVGRRLLGREGFDDPARPRLVGLVPTDGRTKIAAGSILVGQRDLHPPIEKLGHVTSVTWSENLGKPIALAFLSGGRERLGQKLYAAYPLRNRIVEVEVTPSCFIDPEGERLRG
ncbi:N-methylglutamate dehydrogenase subunit C [Tistlia consotensis]|uniref:N-methylglutamate dehydrogenase subunit C n=1 Tax=Tistlia consotensis USBA 355 TaxID=560819 RepID=A0A1Y6CY10_9PROT|nr:sarcosine oxidase subunit alpha family protein [Tistlia consotensis]SMF82422.1 N-methylglutamate dehydrogenase subunit C [Tistlia consotensis USBA 355]SNS27161.1 N-methylglutamate dehydrogenase subunit C [Tistlia consotensis]